MRFVVGSCVPVERANYIGTYFGEVQAKESIWTVLRDIDYRSMEIFRHRLDDDLGLWKLVSHYHLCWIM